MSNQIPFPRWTPETVGERGTTICNVMVGDRVVTIGYLVSRHLRVLDLEGRIVSRDATGYGGIRTVPSARRQGYLATWYQSAAFLTPPQDVKMLFCLEALVRRNRELGWTILDCVVTYDQPTGRSRMPPHVYAAIIDPLDRINPATLAAVQIQGYPW